MVMSSKNESANQTTERRHREVNVLWHEFPDSLIIKIGDDSLIVSDEEAEDLRQRLQERQP